MKIVHSKCKLIDTCSTCGAKMHYVKKRRKETWKKAHFHMVGRWVCPNEKKDLKEYVNEKVINSIIRKAKRCRN
ncbi:MAG: hypothetical protein WC755_07050 [Candidatus Woesearchaeota archaeon]